MNETLDLTKPVQTRDGRPVRILCTDRKHPEYPIVGLVLDGGCEVQSLWSASGHFMAWDGISDKDLVNAPMKLATTRVVNFYRMGQNSIGVSVHANRTQADREASSYVWPRIACKEITFEATEGEGL